MTVIVDYNEDDLGKNVYRKKVYYTVMIEQEVLAQSQDEADEMFLNNGGINHDAVDDVATAQDGVETLIVEATYHDSGDSIYRGKVVYEDDEYAEENGTVTVDECALEKETA